MSKKKKKKENKFVNLNVNDVTALFYTLSIMEFDADSSLRMKFLTADVFKADGETHVIDAAVTITAASVIETHLREQGFKYVYVTIDDQYGTENLQLQCLILATNDVHDFQKMLDRHLTTSGGLYEVKYRD